jgi:formylglycine-generating enzyme required for sulfatase activity
VASFALGKYPVTQEQYQAVMGKNPSHFSDNPKHPVEQVSWHEAQEFCQKLSQQTGKPYRLPSEAEWEYACRAGTQSRYYFGDRENDLELYALYSGNSGGTTHPVGQKKPNNWGLYDMHGNVWEWCADDWHNNYYGAPTHGSGWTAKNRQNNAKKMVRGGSWFNLPGRCRSASRGYYSEVVRGDTFGFRVVCAASRTS